jgi:hypothetical protein
LEFRIRGYEALVSDGVTVSGTGGQIGRSGFSVWLIAALLGMTETPTEIRYTNPFANASARQLPN